MQVLERGCNRPSSPGVPQKFCKSLETSRSWFHFCMLQADGHMSIERVQEPFASKPDLEGSKDSVIYKLSETEQGEVRLAAQALHVLVEFQDMKSTSLGAREWSLLKIFVESMGIQ